jgi:hypothetical protein
MRMTGLPSNTITPPVGTSRGGWVRHRLFGADCLITEGDTLEDARAMTIDALRGYLENLVKDGAVPPDEDPQPSMRRIREHVGLSV